MKHTSKIWWWSYGLICLGLFALLGIWGIRDPRSLMPLVAAGGLVESLSTVVLALAAVFSIIVALRLWQTDQWPMGWLLYGGLCFFFTGEEARWGRESILGWQLLAPSEHGWEVHDWFIRLLKTAFYKPMAFSIICLYGISCIGGGTVIAYGLYALQQKRRITIALNRESWSRLPTTFIVLGLLLIILGTVFDVLRKIGLPSFHGQRLLEESLELLGSTALLCAPLSKLSARPQSCQTTMRREHVASQVQA